MSILYMHCHQTKSYRCCVLSSTEHRKIHVTISKENKYKRLNESSVQSSLQCASLIMIQLQICKLLKEKEETGNIEFETLNTDNVFVGHFKFNIPNSSSHIKDMQWLQNILFGNIINF
ncbi:hypothetical protein V1478_004233 [Vespula squamosa]|uniref:Uncharacterized protein n=1 Tax=Vespula squamosa TaxID=30214 RepID=A0ABD2BJY1_VESSQ